MGRMSSAVAICLALLFSGCAARPVLYPNSHLNSVGVSMSKQDIAECEHLADQYVRSHKAEKIAGSAAAGGAVGAAMGAAGGAVLGHAGRGAAVGAASGAAGGFMRGLFRSSQPNPVYKNFVNRCMKDRGYDVIGWE